MDKNDMALPFQIGNVTLNEVHSVKRIMVMPYANREMFVSNALWEILNVGLPLPGRLVQFGSVSAIWAGRGQWFIEGADLEILQRVLARYALFLDQSDAWTTFEVEGKGAPKVLARLCPLDLSPSAFPQGTTARSDLAHVSASISAIQNGFRILAMQSFKNSVTRDLRNAMRSLAAQSEM